MKTPKTLSLVRSIALVSLFACHSAQAASGTWNVDANGLWSLDTNWLSNTIADASGFTANFNNNITADRTVSLDSDRTLTNLVFGDNDTSTAGSWILDNNALSTNNLILAGTTPSITVNALGTGKTATISAIIEGTSGLSKAGTGTLAITGANTYTGTTIIQNGTLQIGNGGGSLNGITGTALTFAGTGTFNVKEAASSTQGMGQLTFSAGEGSVLSTAAGANSAATITFASMAARTTGAIGNFTLATNTTATNKIVLSDTTNAPVNGSGSNNPGIFFSLNGNSTAAGYARYDTTAGYFRATNYGVDNNTVAAISATATTIAVNDATKDISITAANPGISAQTTAAVNTVKTTNAITLTSGSTLSTKGILLVTGNTSRVVGPNTSFLQPTTDGGELVLAMAPSTSGATGALQIAAVIQNYSGGSSPTSLTKAGIGTVTLQSANTFSGVTKVNSGTLRMTNSLALQNSVLDTSGAGVLNMTQAANTFGGLTGDRDLTLPAAVTGLSLNPGTGVTATYSGVLGSATAGMSLTKTGAGTQVLAGTNTYSGSTSVSAGTLKLNNPNTSNETSTVTIAATGAALELNFSGTDTVGKLFIGESQMADGVYEAIGNPGSGIEIAQITGTGTLAVGVTYTVTYNGNANNGGSVPTDSGAYPNNATVSVRTNSGSLTKAGYVFSGWNTQTDGQGTDRAASSTFAMGTANVTLYAKWVAAATYTVTYSGNGNSGGSVPTDSGAYLNNASVSVLTNSGSLTKVGYVFSGWNTQADGQGTDRAASSTFAMGAANVTLYAKWDAATYTVTYDGNGNDGGSVPTDSRSYLNEATVSVLTNSGSLTKAGYVFSGWNTQANGDGTPRAASSTFAMGTANVTLYAKWEAATYTVTYDGNGNDGGSVPTDSGSYLNGATVSVLTNSGSLTKTGYVFSGWNTLANGLGTDLATSFVMGTANVTLYAKWVAATYTVTYSGNGSDGGSVPTDSGSYLNEASVSVLTNSGSLTKTGYAFSGWNTLANGDGTNLEAGDTFAMGTANVTLYAKWIINNNFSSWAATHAGGGAVNGDFDNDGIPNGVEYFMNITTPGFTANETLDGNNTVMWSNGGNIPSSAYGTQFVVQISSDLSVWNDVPATGDSNLSNTSSSVSYTLTGTTPLFVRLVVTPD